MEIKSFLDRINEIKDYARIMNSFIEREGGNSIFTYAGPYISPARFSSLAFTTLTGQPREWIHPQDLLYYRAPYDEHQESSVIVFTSCNGMSTLNLLTDQLTWTGHRMLVFAECKLPHEISHKLRDEEVVEVGGGPWLLTTHMLSAIAASLSKEANKVRAGKVLKELSTLPSIIDDLVREYNARIKELRDFLSSGPTVVTWTPTMHGVYEALKGKLRERMYLHPCFLGEAEEASKEIGRVAIFSTDVEEYSVKPVKSLSLTSNVKVFEFKIRTDPITAPIYGLLLMNYIAL